MSIRMRRQLSPTAQLLRSSRLFAVPNALPTPSMDIAVSGTLKSSKTATIPYPTRQAIATPASSLGRGDWGLKRPLPLKSTTRTSRPVLRLLSNDTIEHITDFDSAQDHVQTLQKWTEMGIALSYGGKRERDPSKMTNGQKGAFERSIDSTDPDDEHMVKRWKYKGPWLASLDAKKFQKYITHKLSKRKDEFRAHLAEYIRLKVVKARRDEAQRHGRDISLISDEVSADDLKVHYRLFRQELQEVTITSELVQQIVIPFLDLPPVQVEPYSQSLGPSMDQFTVSHDTTPLTTHPSAGLSYLRSNTYMYNHPLLGPQQYKQPTPARVLIPARTSTGGRGRAILGVAGIAADDSESDSVKGGGSFSANSGVAFLDTETEGGKKIWVSSSGANITPDARIMLHLARAPREAVEVGLGRLEEAPPPGVKKAPVVMPFGGARLDEPLA
ncbi:uncharacterized protein BDZ99DRAFT_466208 [Mytilinidion resinicola]|uniref:Mitochondrial ribosomal protein MRP51 n=1 Tax=Mytilinidion resinicola TaxID=574789 RepID=A0A6A6YDE4_9PEZI|nr:uncharacterized protein BDZ99DRAFT_466208 [Mytilinidion resinicola]KAF2805867.1 hypothetical protein BDZ99DRAFT_466208 [Mytilinidion resinicola]